MKTPREAEKTLKYWAREYLRYWGVKDDAGFDQEHELIRVIRRAVSAAIEARDAEHAAEVAEAVLLLRLMQRAAADAHCGLRVVDEFLAAAPAVVPAETPPVTMDTGDDEPWSVREVLARLADAADHLLGDHSCDTHGHEGIRYAVDAARRYLNAPRAPAPAVTPVPAGAAAVPHEEERHFETREVLADAYPRRRATAMLTHLVEVRGGRDVGVVCKRVRNDSLADGGSLDTTGRRWRPTCQPCGRRWDAILRACVAATPPTPSAPTARVPCPCCDADPPRADGDCECPESCQEASAPPREGMGMLTKGQREELARLRVATQCTYGKGRARVQNALVAMRLAAFFDDGSGCCITDAGIEASTPPGPGTPGGGR